MKKILLSALAIVAMTGCTKIQPVNEELPDKPIVVKTNVVASKAIADNDSEFGLQYVRDDKNTSWADVLKNATRDGSNGSIGLTENYNKDNTKAYFKFFSDKGTPTGTTITWTPDGKTDLVYNKGEWDAGTYNDPIATGLALDHMLTRIEVVLQGKGGEDLDAIKSSWGNITEIKITGLPSTIIYDYAATADAITYGTTTTTETALYKGLTYEDPFESVVIGGSGNKTVVGGVMLPSGTTTTQVTLLITSVEAGSKSIPVTFVAAIEAGKTNTITLTFSAADKAVGVSSTVKDWGTGTTGSGAL